MYDTARIYYTKGTKYRCNKTMLHYNKSLIKSTQNVTAKRLR